MCLERTNVKRCGDGDVNERHTMVGWRGCEEKNWGYVV